MKYLYKILRLFFCPHKWTTVDMVDSYRSINDPWPISRKHICRCNYCGTITKFRS